MLDRDIRNNLVHVRTWAQGKINTAAEPQWSWYQYMKLIEAVDVLVGRMDVLRSVEQLQDSTSYLERRLRLVESTESPRHAREVPGKTISDSK